MKNNCVLILFFSALFFQANAQTDRIQVSTGFGHILDIYPNFPETHASITAQLDWLASNRSIADEHAFIKPEYGLSLSYAYLDNDEILGRSIGLQGNFQTYHHFGKRAEWTIGFAFGAAYFTEEYDYINNLENNMTGSALSFMATGNIGLRYSITEQWKVFSNFKYHHTSNAHLVLPNVGMNMMLLELGVSYDLRDKENKADSTTYTSLIPSRKFYPYTRFFYGLNELGETTSPTNGARYFKAGVALGVNYLWKPGHVLSAEIAGYYDDANFTYLLLEESKSTEASRVNASAIMLLLGHEFVFAKFGFVTQLGVNIHQPGLAAITNDLSDPSTMDRIGRWIPGRFCLNFYPLGRTGKCVIPMLNIGVKTHLGGADFLETGISLQLGKIN